MKLVRYGPKGREEPGVIGSDDPLLKPRGSIKMDWEIELGLVIGRKVRDLASPSR